MKKYEKPFHGSYFQGTSRKQYESSGKIFLFAVVCLVVLILIEFFSNF